MDLGVGGMEMCKGGLTFTESYFLKIRISEVVDSHHTKSSKLTNLQLLW